MTDLEQLAERVEALSEQDRELDADIALAVDGGEIVWKMANYTMESYPARRYVSEHHVGGYGNAPVPAYTASLDAAMSLVPEGWTWGKVHDAGHDWMRCYPADHWQQVALKGAWGDRARSCATTYCGDAAALTAAALRARSAK